MPSAEHNRLVALGVRWLRKQGFGVVASELTATGCREQPDVIGFRSSCSAIIEVKVSKSDFIADQRKPERQGTTKGVGQYRFYLCPIGLLTPSEMPQGWGLLYEDNGRIMEVLRPLGNMWPGEKSEFSDWNLFLHEIDLQKERAILYSVARRLAKGDSVK